MQLGEGAGSTQSPGGSAAVSLRPPELARTNCCCSQAPCLHPVCSSSPRTPAQRPCPLSCASQLAGAHVSSSRGSAQTCAASAGRTRPSRGHMPRHPTAFRGWSLGCLAPSAGLARAPFDWLTAQNPTGLLGQPGHPIHVVRLLIRHPGPQGAVYRPKAGQVPPLSGPPGEPWRTVQGWGRAVKTE